jgi:hypothetical protein
MPMTKLEDEAVKITALLKGKTVKLVHRHRAREIAIQFTALICQPGFRRAGHIDRQRIRRQ